MDKLNTIRAAMEALSRIEDMLDDMDVKSTDDMRNPKDAPADEPEQAQSDSETDASLAPDENKEDLGDEDMADELNEMADKGHPGARGAMDFFSKKKKDEEGDE